MIKPNTQLGRLSAFQTSRSWAEQDPCIGRHEGWCNRSVKDKIGDYCWWYFSLPWPGGKPTVHAELRQTTQQEVCRLDSSFSGASYHLIVAYRQRIAGAASQYKVLNIYT
ncbi:unnamed protein product [Protopolystoma xenopodis]|uniref:Uncharacterized protein n=1 Tax=Protopolystoma xenopodis TaxID=117903 RepID=A0A448WDK6_9PLAT|nr:unnamed protein product [Protopolystoma xenopodis]